MSEKERMVDKKDSLSIVAAILAVGYSSKLSGLNEETMLSYYMRFRDALETGKFPERDSPGITVI